jgi:hypothetical protein
LSRRGRFQPFSKICTCVLVLEKENSPIYRFQTSTIPIEALATGRCAIISESLHKKEPYSHLKNGEEILAVNPDNSEDLRRTLIELMENPDKATNIGNNGHQAILKYDNFTDMLLNRRPLLSLNKN